jgi:hypothetical protein
VRLFEHPDFGQAILQAAEHFQDAGLRPAIIEKDYYVTEVLRIIATTAADKVSPRPDDDQDHAIIAGYLRSQLHEGHAGAVCLLLLILHLRAARGQDRGVGGLQANDDYRPTDHDRRSAALYPRFTGAVICVVSGSADRTRSRHHGATGRGKPLCRQPRPRAHRLQPLEPGSGVQFLRHLSGAHLRRLRDSVEDSQGNRCTQPHWRGTSMSKNNRGAAARLGLKRTSLAYRMQKLGIVRAQQ